MPSAERQLIEDQFGVPVLSTYQAVEALRIGFQCEERRGFHLFVDDLAVRVVDDEGHDLAPGQRGHLLISNLTNRATVLLNFRLGDIVRLASEPCACGRSLPTIESIEGRSDDLLLLPSGEEVHALAILEGVRAVPGVIQVQIVQEEPERFELRCVSAPGADRPAAAESLLEALSAGLGIPVLATVTWLEQIPTDTAGKTKAVISHCPPIAKAEAAVLAEIRELHALRGNRGLSAEELAALRLSKLKAVLHHAYEHVPFYRTFWREAGVSPDDLRSLEDLSQWPVITKQQLKQGGRRGSGWREGELRYRDDPDLWVHRGCPRGETDARPSTAPVSSSSSARCWQWGFDPGTGWPSWGRPTGEDRTGTSDWAFFAPRS